MASPPSTGLQFSSSVSINSNVKKCGYLKKHKHGHRRFFVLKEQSEGFPAKLEYYESEKKWKNKSTAKRVIPLDSCLCINKRADAKYKHLIALYTKDEYFAVAAENENEQENWYTVLTDVMTGGKVCDGSESNSASSLVGFDEANYGVITPASAVYKEVWQVNLKSKGLGQSKNLTGVYRLCLSSRKISFVKLNSDSPSVSLQLMNIRRCGHSDSFFFIEVGRSAATGPGEFWMQADDSVVAQNIHETILEAMKSMKELSEFRPRSKSQSSSTNPISVPTRRNLNNLPPSQTGLVRRSRTESMVAASPVNKFSSCRIRTASEGDGCMIRPVSMSISVSGSPTSPFSNRIPLSRSDILTARQCRTLEPSNLPHSRSMSMSMPASPSPPLASSLGNLSSSFGTNSNQDTSQQPLSCNASISGSPNDTGFMLCDEYSSSPGYGKLTNRSNTPDSFSSTPPSQEVSDGYMLMERQVGHRLVYRGETLDLEKAYRKRTYSLTTPRHPRAPSQLSSSSLDEYTLMRAANANGSQSGRSSYSASPKVSYPEDYGDVAIGPSKSTSGTVEDEGYMPMTPGVAPLQGGKEDNYMPMSPMSVSAPKQIINPRMHPLSEGAGFRNNSPSSSSVEDSGYMRMWCGIKSSTESLSDGRLANGEYMNMSPGNTYSSLTPPDYFPAPLPCELPSLPSHPPFSSSRSQGPQAPKTKDADQYVLMSPQDQRMADDSDGYILPVSSSPVRRNESLPHRGKMGRPNRLYLDTLKTLPSMNEHPIPGEPKSPGEYINIEFSPHLASVEGHSLPLGPSSGKNTPISNDMINKIKSHSTKFGDTSVNPLNTMPEFSVCPSRLKEDGYQLENCDKSKRPPIVVKEDYTEMTYGVADFPSLQVSQTFESAINTSVRLQKLDIEDQAILNPGVFSIEGGPPFVDQEGAAKVIRADPQGRRRNSSETFSSTTTVMPVFPSFAGNTKRHSSASVENVSVRSSEGSDDEYGSPMSRETSAGFQNGLNYFALNLMDNRDLGTCNNLVSFKSPSSCKGGIHGLHTTPYVCLGFKDRTATAED